jgi:hypothetical protein
MVPITEAINALDSGDPALIHYQCRTGDWYEHGYFAGATLLHHIAGNPIRCHCREHCRYRTPAGWL